MARLAGVFVGCGAAFGDHLVEPAIEPRQRVGNAIGRARIGGRRSDGHLHRRRRRRTLHENGWRCALENRRRRALHNRRRLREASLRHALELPRQVVETVMNRREVITLVVGSVPI